MARLACFVFTCVVCVGALAQNEFQPNAVSYDREHSEWVTDALRAIQTIKPGMTRSDLARLFATERGLSTFSESTYVYRQCPYIKIDVKFSASGPQERPTDKIVEVSRPYLAWRTLD